MHIQAIKPVRGMSHFGRHAPVDCADQAQAMNDFFELQQEAMEVHQLKRRIQACGRIRTEDLYPAKS